MLIRFAVAVVKRIVSCYIDQVYVTAPKVMLCVRNEIVPVYALASPYKSIGFLGLSNIHVTNQ